MKHEALAMAVVIAVLGWSLGCGSNSPLTPASDTTFTSTLKVTAPTPVAPLNNQVMTSQPTLTATASTAIYGTFPLQYRFQVFSGNGTLVQDSGLVSGPSWKVTLTLTPQAPHTWQVRAEYQGGAGPWSTPGSFIAPNPLPPLAPTGDWEHCGALTSERQLVECVHDVVQPTNSSQDLEVVKRVAWLLRGQGAGLLIKNSGDNIVLWQGYSFSASRICMPVSAGQLWKIIGDAGPGGSNGPTFDDNGTVDPSTCVPAMDPNLP